MSQVSLSLPNKASMFCHSLIYSGILVGTAKVDPSQVHIQNLNRHVLLLLYWIFSWIYRKYFGSVWTFLTPRTRRHKDRCITISHDNYTCEVYHTPLWWLHVLSKGRRALPETWTQSLSEIVERQYWQIKGYNRTSTSITLGCIVYSTLLRSYSSLRYWETHSVLLTLEFSMENVDQGTYTRKCVVGKDEKTPIRTEGKEKKWSFLTVSRTKVPPVPYHSN